MANEHSPEQTKEIMEHEKPSKKRNIQKLLAWSLILLLIASNLIFIFLWYKADKKNDDYKKERTEAQKQIETLKDKVAAAEKEAEANKTDTTTETEDATPCQEVASASLKENIKAALDTKNTAVFETYTTNPVKYVLAASEYGGNITPTQAATSLEYTHSATGPWDFSLPAATIAAYDAGFYTDYFGATTYVGRAASGMVVAFDFNCSDKIKNIFVAADEDIL